MGAKRFTSPKSRKAELECMEMIMLRFFREVSRKGHRDVKDELTPDFTKIEVTPALLGEWRTKLSRMVRAGMNERKDMEIEIAYLAAIVWFLRQVDEERWVENPNTMW